MLRRLWFLLTRGRRQRELDDEMRLHLELREAVYKRDGNGRRRRGPQGACAVRQSPEASRGVPRCLGMGRSRRRRSRCPACRPPRATSAGPGAGRRADARHRHRRYHRDVLADRRDALQTRSVGHHWPPRVGCRRRRGIAQPAKRALSGLSRLSRSHDRLGGARRRGRHGDGGRYARPSAPAGRRGVRELFRGARHPCRSWTCVHTGGRGCTRWPSGGRAKSQPVDGSVRRQSARGRRAPDDKQSALHDHRRRATRIH